jgi:hypothetical protein
MMLAISGISHAAAAGAARPPAAASSDAGAGGGGGLRDPAPRPAPELRIQNRFARNASSFHIFGGVDYLERRDFYVSPGLRLGGTYYVTERLGVEVQGTRFFSQLSDAAEQVQRKYGALPDSRAPGWLLVGGLRYAFGYGKMMMAAIDQAVHFQPQALLQAGMHLHEGSLGPSMLTGLGLLVHVTTRLFVRLDGAVTLEIEERASGATTLIGFLPSLVLGGTL